MSLEQIKVSLEKGATLEEEPTIDGVCRFFKEKIKERYGKDGENPLDFHNEKHPERLAENSVEFLKTVQKIDPDLVSEEDLEAAEVISWGHDLFQNSTFNKETGRIARHRGFFPDDIPDFLRKEEKVVKGNERVSTDEIIEKIKKAGLEISQTKIEDGVAATLPSFSFDKEGRLRICQPYLKPESSISTLAIAEGDLRGDLWSEDFNVFKDSGNAEFRELNRGISMEVKKMTKDEAQMSSERKGAVLNSILDWVKGQIDFASSQKELFWEAIDNNKFINGSAKSKEIKDALREKYLINIEKNVEMAKKRYEILIAGLKEKYDLGDDPKEWPEKLKSIDNSDFNSLLEEIGY